jgi:hypothetical protein
MRITIIIDIAMTEIRVALFDMVKQKSNSARKNVAMLSQEEGVHKRLSESNPPKAGTYDHMSNAHGRLKTIAIGSRPKALRELR